MKEKYDSTITIVTAFFDIGRGNLQSKEELPDYMTRTNDTYFEYFSNLATLDNPMVIFSDNEHIERIKKIRGNKPTKIIPFNINKFDKILLRIKEIQNSKEFKSKVRPDLLKNIEYWNHKYVLVTNLKSYLVNKAIKDKLVHTELVSWVDFGYVRDLDTLNNIKKWKYHFSDDKIHFFTIKNNHVLLNKSSDVYHAIFNNIVFVIGGAIVSHKKNWNLFFKANLSSQKLLLKNNIVDDDQGVFLMTIIKEKDKFKFNYLGKDKWFHLFKKFDETAKVSLKERIKDFFL
ncbi:MULTISPECIES: protein YibB [Haemophilus]|uniref:Protein YibB n=1 Tax=Haemophilus parainfluenzae TaxID=729 RepID=A0AAQ0KCW9_HAEPA|nr:MULTISPECIES: protein YibB [Haemophilus]MBS5013341.1 protein YibB [Haemophilus parainfluenzae]RDE84668.1 protein YibB [Haemophilus parainfluenzae]